MQLLARDRSGIPIFFVIFCVTVFFLSLDSVIGYVSDFLVKQNTSIFGISLFVCISAVFILGSLLLFRFISNSTSNIRANSIHLRMLHIVSLATVLVLVAILLILLTEILLFTEYSAILLVVTTAISPTVAAGVMVVSSYMLISWYRFNRSSYVVLIFAIAFSINAYAFMYSMIRDMSGLMEKDQIITPQSEVVYSSDTYEPGSIELLLFNIYKYAATASFLLLLVGSAIMLRHYSYKVGRAKFWALVLVPSLYSVTILLDTFGIYAPESEADLFNYYVFTSLSGIIGGALLGFLFWSISRTMRPNKSVNSYLLICSYGFVLLFVATVGQVSVAAYPPYGFATYAMLTLSSYMIIIGLYAAASSISQDVRLRQYIKDLTRKDSSFFSAIGHAQLEKQVQSKASDLEQVVKEQRMELEKKSGVQSSIQEQDIKQYLLEVLQEVDRHKSSQ
jgi:hypothetical protein